MQAWLRLPSPITASFQVWTKVFTSRTDWQTRGAGVCAGEGNAAITPTAVSKEMQRSMA
jgi:hypothetical protein